VLGKSRSISRWRSQAGRGVLVSGAAAGQDEQSTHSRRRRTKESTLNKAARLAQEEILEE
jgi:hypothetical protein